MVELMIAAISVIPQPAQVKLGVGVVTGALDGNEFVPGSILLQGDHSNASFRNMILTKTVK